MSDEITAEWLESIGGVHEAELEDDGDASTWADGWYIFDIGHEARWLSVSPHENEVEIHADKPRDESTCVTFSVKSRKSFLALLKAFRSLRDLAKQADSEGGR